MQSNIHENWGQGRVCLRDGKKKSRLEWHHMLSMKSMWTSGTLHLVWKLFHHLMSVTHQHPEKMTLPRSTASLALQIGPHVQQKIRVLSCRLGHEDCNPSEINKKMCYKFRIKGEIEDSRVASLANSEDRGSGQHRSTGIIGGWKMCQMRNKASYRTADAIILSLPQKQLFIMLHSTLKGLTVLLKVIPAFHSLFILLSQSDPSKPSELG